MQSCNGPSGLVSRCLPARTPTSLVGTTHQTCTCRPGAYPAPNQQPFVAFQTTVGWSLLTSGIVTLLLVVIPGDSVWWGIALLLVGIAVLGIRQFD